MPRTLKLPPNEALVAMMSEDGGDEREPPSLLRDPAPIPEPPRLVIEPPDWRQVEREAVERDARPAAGPPVDGREDASTVARAADEPAVVRTPRLDLVRSWGRP